MNEKYSLKEELFTNLKLDYPFKNLLEVPLSKLLSINTLDQLYQLTRQAEGQTFTEKDPEYTKCFFTGYATGS